MKLLRKLVLFLALLALIAAGRFYFTPQLAFRKSDRCATETSGSWIGFFPSCAPT
jgi:hypothetical protein